MAADQLAGIGAIFDALKPLPAPVKPAQSKFGGAVRFNVQVVADKDVAFAMWHPLGVASPRVTRMSDELLRRMDKPSWLQWLPRLSTVMPSTAEKALPAAPAESPKADKGARPAPWETRAAKPIRPTNR